MLESCVVRCGLVWSGILSSCTLYIARITHSNGESASMHVVSPRTRAALLTGRTNERSCIHSALACDQEDPAMTCAMGRGLPHSEFTIADAAAKSPHNYMSIMVGKCELFCFVFCGITT